MRAPLAWAIVPGGPFYPDGRGTTNVRRRNSSSSRLPSRSSAEPRLAQLEAALAELKKLGRVEDEAQGGEEVTQQYVDLQARLANGKHTEQRLSEILRTRTGKLQDVLKDELEIDRVRGRLGPLSPEQELAVEALTHGIISKIMHTPISTLKTAVSQPEATTVVDIVRRLFDLQDKKKEDDKKAAKSSGGDSGAKT